MDEYLFRERNHDPKNKVAMYSLIWYLELAFYLFLVSYSYIYLVTNYAYVVFNYYIYAITLFSMTSFIGAWRILEKIWNYCRAFYYKFFKYPKVVSGVDFTKKGDGLFVVVTSWKMGKVINYAVFDELINSLLHLDMKVTVVYMLSKGKLGEQEKKYLEKYFDTFFSKRNHKGLINIEYKYQNGLGKRFALFTAITFILKKFTYSYTSKCAFVFMDGDTIVPKGLLEYVIPFVFHKKIGAVTVGNIPYTQGNQYHRDWMDMRFAKRDRDCCSILSVVTGRLYCVKGVLVTFLYAFTIMFDLIKYPFKGKVKSLTGDDKTVVKLILRMGYDIFYLHDKNIYVMEEPIYPQKNSVFYYFFKIPIFTNILNMERYKKNKFRHGADYIKNLKVETSLAFKYKIFSQFASSFTPVLGLYTIFVMTYFYGEFWFVLTIFYLLVTGAADTISYSAGKYWRPKMIYMQKFENYKEGFIDIFAMMFADVQKWKNNENKLKEHKILKILSYISVLSMIFIFIVLSHYKGV